MSLSGPISSHTHHLDMFLLELAKEADLNRKSYFIGGGFVFDISLGRLTRSHQDIDVFILESDLGWWSKWFGFKGFVVKKDLEQHTPPKAYSVYEQNGDKSADVYPFRLDRSGLMYYKNSSGEYSSLHNYSWSKTKVVPYKGYSVRVEDPEEVAVQKQEFATRINRSLTDFDRHDLGLLEEILGLGVGSK